MGKLFVAPTRFVNVWYTSKGGFKFTVSGNNNIEVKWEMFLKEFHTKGREMLKEQGAALCHEMAKYSMPTRANTYITANDAIKKYAEENLALAGVAFKEWESKSAMFWILSPYSNVAEYVIKKSGFTFTSPQAQHLYNIKKYDLLRDFMLRKGFQMPENIPTPQFVSEKAELSTFIQWKSQYKKKTQRGPYYVRDKASITRIAQEKSIYNYASIVINGWLKASKAIGDKVPSGVQTIRWPYGQSLGWGTGQVRKVKEGVLTLTISNQYYNLNGIFNSPIQRAIWDRRMRLFEAEQEKFFQKMIQYWDSINPPA